MLYCYRYRFLFVHLAKTGGTSVRSALERYRWRDPLFYPQIICRRLSDLTGRRMGVRIPRHAKAITAREMLPGDVFESLFKFAFVRWKLADPERPYSYIVDASIEPQWYSLMDFDGRCLVDFLGRYENLEADYQEACRRIGLPHVPELPHKRKAEGRTDYRRYYSDAGAELVERHFWLDIENLGYRFD